MVVLINIKSGGGTALKKWGRIYKQLNLNEPTENLLIGINGSTDKIILDSIHKGNTDFVIAGGDGSINYFLNRLLNIVEPDVWKEIKIGAVGIGSSNDFHKPFLYQNTIAQVPFKLNFKNAELRDVGCLVFKKDRKLLRKYFLINASLGITAEGNHFFNNPDFILRYLKKVSTQIAITYAVLKNILRYKNFQIKMEINNESFTTHISNLGIIKSPFFTGKLRYQSDPLPDNGLFDLHLYESLSRVKLLKLFYNLSKGLSDISLNKKFWRTDRITISSDKEFAVEFDGEVITTKTVKFSIIPRLIKVCTN